MELSLETRCSINYLLDELMVPAVSHVLNIFFMCMWLVLLLPCFIDEETKPPRVHQKSDICSSPKIRHIQDLNPDLQAPGGLMDTTRPAVPIF